MIQKLNIITYAMVLCLFGFMLFSAPLVFAKDMDNAGFKAGFEKCMDKDKKKKKRSYKKRMKCFRNISKSYTETHSYSKIPAYVAERDAYAVCGFKTKYTGSTNKTRRLNRKGHMECHWTNARNIYNRLKKQDKTLGEFRY